MADTKISALTTDSAPVRDTDYAPTYDASAVATKKVLLSDFGVITYMAYWSLSVAPADSTTYYLSPHASFGLATAVANHKFYVMRAGKITGIRLFGSVGGLGTAENSTVSFRLNDTTDTTVSSVVVFNATPFTIVNTSLSVAVAVGDFFNIKIATPAWVTNPTSVNMYAMVYQS